MSSDEDSVYTQEQPNQKRTKGKRWGAQQNDFLHQLYTDKQLELALLSDTDYKKKLHNQYPCFKKIPYKNFQNNLARKVKTLQVETAVKGLRKGEFRKHTTAEPDPCLTIVISPRRG